MALGEHVLDLAAAVLEPGGHVVLVHGLHPFGLEAPALAHGLHGVKGGLGGQAHLHQLVHDVLAGAEALAQRHDALVDQVLRVAQPHVSAVGKARNADQFLHGGGVGVLQHLAHEGGAELRHAEGAGVAVDVLGRDAQGLGGGEQAQHALVVQGNLAEVHAGQLFQHVQHGRVVVAQNVQLHQDVVHGVEVVVGGDGLGFHVVGGVLHGGELADVVFLRQHHHARRVLAGGAFHAHAARGEAFLFRVGHGKIALL